MASPHGSFNDASAALRRAFCFAFALAPLAMTAQTATSGPAPTPAPPSAAAAGETKVQMNPYTVTSDVTHGYTPVNSRDVTAFNTALDKMPVSADMFDSAFMSDTASTSVEDMIENYSAGAGASALSAGATAAENQPGDRVGQKFFQLRGLMTPNIQRNQLLFVGTLGGPGGTTVGGTNNWDLEGVDIIFGPQALLYDGGGAGGVINLRTKEAMAGQPSQGTITLRTDNFGTKYGLFDYNASAGENLAMRVVVIDTSDQTRRVNIGDHLNGAYAQLVDTFGKTQVRVTVEQTVDNTNNGYYTKLTTSGDPTYGAVTGYSPGYLLATGQAAGIDDNELNWGNVNSFGGNLESDTTVTAFAMIEADTALNDWLSSQLSAGISNFTDTHSMDVGPIDLYSPNATGNPIPGSWTMGMTNAYGEEDSVRPFHGQGLRYSLLATNDLFGGKVKSQTELGADLVDNRGGIIEYAYYAANSNWQVYDTANPLPTALGKASDALGRQVLGPLSWTVNNGPVLYPTFTDGAPRVTWKGQNYVLAMQNPFNTADVSSGNPLGGAITAAGAPNGLHDDAINDGIYLTNYSNWLDGKLDTLMGVRLEHAYTDTARPYIANSPTPVEIIDSHSFNFNVGADYHVLPWLTPYFSVTNSYLVPPVLDNTPDGAALPVSEALGEEVGLKVNNASGTLSGTLALYHNEAKNEEFLMTDTLEDDINPTGLNGQYDTDNSYAYSADAETEGAQLTLTAQPTPNWRLRVSAAYTDGRIQSNAVFGALYNDQFNENSSGQVTYQDGSVVYVNPAKLSTPVDLAHVTGTDAGYVPLTVTMLSTPGGLYYAAPKAITGAITGTSGGGTVLKADGNNAANQYGHGPILTGATGLPTSDYQLNPALSGVPVQGTMPAALSGDATTGYPVIAVNSTAIYEFSSGWAKGLMLGGSTLLGWKDRDYYYYPNGLATSTNLYQGWTIFYLPTMVRFDLIAGYTRKFRRVTFSTQLNVRNIFNYYQTLVFPDIVTGWTNPANEEGNLDYQPRSFIWTNRIIF